MKKLFPWILGVALLLICVCVLPTEADAATSGYYTYTVSNGKATVIGCSTSISGDISIPSTLGGYPVTSIGYSAFLSCTSLTSITIPDSVTSIDYSAFEYCTNLTSVTISDSVTSIGGRAFYDCSKLTSVTIPDSVISIGSGAFGNCTSLTSITIPDSVTSIGNSAFAGCKKLKSITIPNGVTSIGDSAFFNCDSLTSVTLGNGVTSIGDSAFQGCEKLTAILVDKNNTVYCNDSKGVLFNKDKTDLIFAPGGISGHYTIPDSVTIIRSSAFAWCYNLTSVTIPDSVTRIGSSAFYFCTSLQYNTYSNGKYLGNEFNPYLVLAGTTSDSITSINIHSKTKIIDARAFYFHTSLTSINIPDSVTSIGDSAFYHCESLTKVIYCGTQERWNAVSVGYDNEKLINATVQFHDYQNGVCTFCDFVNPEKDWQYTVSDGKATVTGYTGTQTDLTIPSTLGGYPVTSIGNGVFVDCDSLTSITIPDSVTSIGNHTFSGCTSLTSVTIPNSVTDIGSFVFSQCYSLTNIIIPDSVTSIGDGTFSECTSLNSINIPNSITSIGDKTFSHCYKLTSVTIPNSVTSIGSDAFYFCTSLTNITIPDSVTSIGMGAFHYSSLTSIIIPDSITSISGWAFYDCHNLTNITIPGSITSIGDSAFYVCTSLTKVIYCGTQEQWNAISVGDGNNSLTDATLQFHDYQNGVCTICSASDVALEDWEYTISNGEVAITGYTGSNTVLTIPSTIENLPVTSIGTSAFYNCTNLTSVTIPDGVISIGNYAFRDCTGLTNVSIPDSVTSIGKYAFCSCTSLTSITIPNGVSDIGTYAFYNCANLTSVTIPASVTSIGDSSFSNCTNLTAIFVDDNNTVYCNDSKGVLFNKDKTALISAPGAISGHYTIPASVTSISNYAFQGCSSLTDITISSNVTTIGNGALSYCSGLTSITIPNSVTSIGTYAFQYCTGLTSIAIPNSVTSIADYAFRRCNSLTSVVYCGTQDQWKAISIGASNAYLTSATLQYHKWENNTCTICGYINVPANVVAKIGENSYSSLKDAYDAAVDGDTIVLTKQFNGVGFDIEKAITIDLNGNRYYVTAPADGTTAFRVYAATTIKNGRIYIHANAQSQIDTMIETYANLTVTDVQLRG
ncbi:MAG: leucine-rich repeat domain-containing protein, partial [Oscillospiraceae bacterium]|nr:leucine-rich repeat domain-containing protein [Oscillospiraceae bacterium]